MNLLVIVARSKGELSGYLIIGHESSKWATGHFLYSDHRFSWLARGLTHAACDVLVGLGVRYLNVEEDLGNAGLRTSKMSYNPVVLLPKSFVSWPPSVS